MDRDKERSNCARVEKEVPLPPGWKWAMVVGEPAVEGPGRQRADEHSWLTWYEENKQWVVRVIPAGYKDDPRWMDKLLMVAVDSTDVVEAAKVLAGYVWMGMVSP